MRPRHLITRRAVGFHRLLRRSTRSLAATLAVVVAGVAAGASPLHAQTVSGVVTAADDGRPIAGAFVTLHDANGRRQSGSPTDGEGRYALRASAPGEYTLRVELIGFETVTTPVLKLEAGGTWYPFAVPVRAIALPGLAVETERRCRRRDDGVAVHTLWQEIRKALELTEHTERAGGIRYTLLQHVRETDVQHRHVLREERTRRILIGPLPYRAAGDAEELMRGGFTALDGEELMLYGPDAEVLLSDAFAEGYCFRLVQGRTAGDVGLGFEPVQRRRSGADVQGVLWVDRASAELRRLEYTYVGLPPDIARHEARGDIHFRRLPNGAWIVDRWWITSPLVTYDPLTFNTRAVGRRQEGGTVLGAHHAGTVLYELRGTGSVTGRVHDDVWGEPRAGTLVSLSGTPYTAVTDSTGAYLIEGVPPGAYAIAVASDWMLELRTPAPLDSIVIIGERMLEKQLATPSLAEAMRWRCPDTPQRSARIRHGVIYGTVHHAETGEPLKGVVVRADYARTMHDEITDEHGRYAFCWVPQSETAPVRLRLWTREHRTPRVSLLLTEPVLRHDFY